MASIAVRAAATGVQLGAAAARSCTTAPAAPRPKASPTKRWPSACAPAKAKNSSPPRTARESIAAPRSCAWASPASTRPPAALAASLARKLAKALLQRPPDLLDVGERQLAIADDLLALVSLAGHQHRPAGSGGGERGADRLATVGHQPVAGVAARLHSLLDRGHDRQRVLAARVVGGDDRQVGQLAGGPPHRRALARIAFAAAAEHHRHLDRTGPIAAGDLAHRLESGGQRRPGMGIVDVHRERLGAGHPLPPPRGPG